MPRLPPLLQLQGTAAENDVPVVERDGSDATSPKANPIRSIMHVTGEIHTRLEDYETIRRQKALKIREAARLRGDTDLDDAAVLPEVKRNNPRRLKMSKIHMKVGALDGHIIRIPDFCETGDEAPASPTRQNISHMGNWLDRRAFSTINDCYYTPGKGRSTSISLAKGEVSEGDRFFLRRCKDVLKKRHQTLQQAWQKLHVHLSEPVTLVEFVAATTSLFKAYEARLLYRLLDAKSDGSVTFRELQMMLESS